MDDKGNPQIADASLLAAQLFSDEIINFLFQRDPEHRFIFSQEYQETALDSDLYRILDKSVEVIEQLIRNHVNFAFDQLKVMNNVTMAIMNYAESLAKKYFADGLDAEKMLYFAVHVTSIAFKFHQQGVAKIDFSVFMIMNKCFCDFGIFQGGWEALQETASKILKDAERGEGLPSHYQDSISLDYFANLEASSAERPTTSKSQDSNLEQSTDQQTICDTAESFIPLDILQSTSSDSSGEECSGSSHSTSRDNV